MDIFILFCRFRISHITLLYAMLYEINPVDEILFLFHIYLNGAAHRWHTNFSTILYSWPAFVFEIEDMKQAAASKQAIDDEEALHI